MPDADVYARLFPGRGQHESVYAQPDWSEVHRELARVGVTLKLLHSEYRDACATAHRYDPVALKGNIGWRSTARVSGAHTIEYSHRSVMIWKSCIEGALDGRCQRRVNNDP